MGDYSHATSSEQVTAAVLDVISGAAGTRAGDILAAVIRHEDDLAQLVTAAVAKGLTSPRPLDYDALHEAVHAAWTGQAPQPA